MLLAFDIGNTNIVVGAFSADRLLFESRFKTDTARTIDEYEALLFACFQRKLGQEAKFLKCIISSVVPPITPDIVRLVADRLNLQALVIGPGTKSGLCIKIDDPRAVGADRVVNAVAARDLYGAPALVVDFGTATTIDFVSAEGSYEGGLIAPGVSTALDALVSKAAKLPPIELVWPDRVIGKSTVSAMQSGTILGYSCLIDGLIERVIAEVGPIQNVIATGGLGRLFAEHSRFINKYDPILTLQGLRLIAERNG